MAISYGTLASRFLKSQPALNSGAEVLLFTQLPPLGILNSTILQSLEERLPLTFTSPMSVHMKYCKTASPCQLLDHLGQEFVISGYQPPSCLHLQQIKVSSEAEVSHKDQGLWIHRVFQLWGRSHIFPHEVAFSRQLQQLFPHWSAYQPWFMLPQVVLQQSSIAFSLLSHMKGNLPPCRPAGSSWRACTHPPQHCSPVSCPTAHTWPQLDPSPATECRPPIAPICSHTEC